MKKLNLKTNIIFIALAMFFVSCDEENISNEPNNAPLIVTHGTMTDHEGNVYKTVTLGGQTWMAENLRVTTFNDGTPIPKTTTPEEWEVLNAPGCCSYRDTTNQDFIKTHGLLYNWYAVNTGKLAPKGWHVPTDEDWKKFEITLGLSPQSAEKGGGRGVDQGGKLKEEGFAHWNEPNAYATNESGFTALPSGYCHHNGVCVNIGRYAKYWTSSAFDAYDTYAWYRYVTFENGLIYRYYGNKTWGSSVRCVKD